MLKRGFKLIEYENRLERVQAIMYRDKIDILLITSEFFMRYFTGFSASSEVFPLLEGVSHL